MPRKQNGFGNFKVKSVNGVSNKLNKGIGGNAFGNYPRVRSFGSTFTRSAIEQYNYESTWARWRRGFEYYSQGAYLDFTETNAVLYQGSDFEVPVTFTGHRFATKNADSRTHYSIKREADPSKTMGRIVERYNDEFEYPTYKLNNEIWTKVQITDPRAHDLLTRSIGERLTDGETSASVKYILNSNQRPAVYTGKAPPTGMSVTVRIPLDEIRATEFIQNNNGDLQSLVGEAVYMPDFFRNRPVTLFDQFIDGDNAFFVRVTEFVGGQTLKILDTSTGLPPTLGEINDFEQIYTTTESAGGLNGDFIFAKQDYQRFFGQQYLTADVVRGQVSNLSYGILPWTIQSVSVEEGANVLSITSEPFQSTMQLFTANENDYYVIFNDKGFTKQSVDNNEFGEYNHPPEIPGDPLWQKLNISVDPWMDEIFTNNQDLKFADLYTCSCPAYLHAIIRSPEAYNSETGEINRQYRAPIPTAKGASSYEGIGLLKTAGIAQSWATGSYKKSYKVCKHTIASMFINKLRVEEPNTFPSGDAREAFETKLAADVNEVAAEFGAQLRRSEITTVEIIYALAEALNLDDIELGYVLLTANF